MTICPTRAVSSEGVAAVRPSVGHAQHGQVAVVVAPGQLRGQRAFIVGVDGDAFVALDDMSRRQHQVGSVDDTTRRLPLAPTDEYERRANTLDGVGHLIGKLRNSEVLSASAGRV